jgi:glutamine synthetase
MISLGVAKVPAVAKDNTDRNRTSPFAFTGNKFEFRAVGSSASCSLPISVLNSAVAEAMAEMIVSLKERITKAGDRDRAVLDLVRDTIIATEAIRFEGNNYSQEWRDEAEKRGLAHLKNTPEALAAFNYPSTKKLLAEQKVLSEAELQSRVHIQYERYIKKLDIEVDCMRTLVDGYVVPATTAYINDLAEAAFNLTKITGIDRSAQESTAKKLGELMRELVDKRTGFEIAYQSSTNGSDEQRSALLANKVLPAMLALREVCDKIEPMVGNSYWPLPKYREMLFCY